VSFSSSWHLFIDLWLWYFWSSHTIWSGLPHTCLASSVDFEWLFFIHRLAWSASLSLFSSLPRASCISGLWIECLGWAETLFLTQSWDSTWTVQFQRYHFPAPYTLFRPLTSARRLLWFSFASSPQLPCPLWCGRITFCTHFLYFYTSSSVVRLGSYIFHFVDWWSSFPALFEPKIAPWG